MRLIQKAGVQMLGFAVKSYGAAPTGRRKPHKWSRLHNKVDDLAPSRGGGQAGAVKQIRGCGANCTNEAESVALRVNTKLALRWWMRVNGVA